MIMCSSEHILLIQVYYTCFIIHETSISASCGEFLLWFYASKSSHWKPYWKIHTDTAWYSFSSSLKADRAEKYLEIIEVACVHKMGDDENNKCRIILGTYKGLHVPGAFGQVQCLCSPRNTEKMNYSRYCLKNCQEN